ncbi:MAG: hypothetical protein ACYCO0_01490 [Candidatus Micrarchaeaceae archaeon]
MENQRQSAGRFARPAWSSSSLASGQAKTIKMAALFAIIVVMVTVVLLFYVKSQIASSLNQHVAAPKGLISANLSSISDGMLAYNYSNYLVAYSRLQYSQRNASSANLSLTIYPSNPSPQIYLINTGGYCVQCFISSSLLAALNSSLQKYGILQAGAKVNSIDINSMGSIPKGSIIILPSGLIPNILLPNMTYTELCPKYSNTTIISLLNAGDTVIYAGRNFSRSVSCTGQIAQNTNPEISTISQYSNPANSTNSTNPINSTSFNSTLFFNSPTFFLSSGPRFGPVSSAIIFNGTLIALSNYPSSGWDNSPGLLASDIAKAIESRFWIPILAASSPIAIHNSSGEATLFTLNSMIQYSPGISAEVNGSYGLVRLRLSNSNSMREYEMPLRFRLLQNGLIGMPSVVGQTEQVQISAQVYNASNRVVIASVLLYNQNFTQMTVNPIRIGQIGSTAIYTYTSFSIPSGYYIASLQDQSESVYSSALFFVANSSVQPLSMDFRNGSFVFYVSSNGHNVVNSPYSININGAYNATGTVQDGRISYALPKGATLDYGNAVFNVSLLGSSYLIPYPYKTNGINIPPLYIEFAIAAIIIVALNKVLVPISVDEYYIDVPDIKPSKMEHAAETSDSIISVFDKVNSFYHWNRLPLTPDELRSGISNNIKYGNTRMSITIRNTHSILNSLVNKGLVATAGDYFAPSKWIAESGHSIDYLVIYRKLRDYCIANAMLLTEMDSSNKADVIVTNKGAQNYVKIYSSSTKMKDIEISLKVKSFIIFIDEESRLQFLDRLYMSYGNNAEILKMAIDYGNVRLVDSDDLSELKL